MAVRMGARSCACLRVCVFASVRSCLHAVIGSFARLCAPVTAVRQDRHVEDIAAISRRYSDASL
jgi:hypothetical protein